MLSLLAIGISSQTHAEDHTWLPAAHRYRGVYDAGVVGNRGLQYQMVVAWNQGKNDSTKRGWIVTGQDENRVRLSMDYGATWGFPKLAGMYCAGMAGLYLNTDDDIFVAVGNSTNVEAGGSGYAGLYVGDSSLRFAERVELTRGGTAAFTAVANGVNLDRNINCIGRRPQNAAGTLTNADRPVVVIEQATSGGIISGIYVWLGTKSDVDSTWNWTMARQLTTADYADGIDGILQVAVAPNGDVLLMGEKGAFLSKDLFATAPTKAYPSSGNQTVSSGYFFNGSPTTASGARIGVDEASASGGVYETTNIRTTGTTTPFAKPNGNNNLPANYRVWYLGGSPANPDRLAVCTTGGKPYYSTDGGRNFYETVETKGSGDEQGRYDINVIQSHGDAGFYFCPTDELKCLTPTSQTMARSVDGAVTTDGDLTAFFDGMHTKGVGLHPTDYRKMGRSTQDSGLNLSADGMHWVQPTGQTNGSTGSFTVNGTVYTKFGDAVEAAGGGSMNFLSGSGSCLAPTKNRVVAFYNKNTSGFSNIPVILDDPDGDGTYQNVYFTGLPKTRCTNTSPSPKSNAVAFAGRWAVSNLDGTNMSDVIFTDHTDGASPIPEVHEFIGCFINASNNNLISYWGNFTAGSHGEDQGTKIFRSNDDLGNNNQTSAWYTLPTDSGGIQYTYPCRLICVDKSTVERVLYVRSDDLNVIREIKKVSGVLQDNALINLRTMSGGVVDTIRTEIGNQAAVIPELPIQQLIADPNRSGVFYAIVGRQGAPNWWRTIDNGVTWTNISGDSPRTLWTGIVHPQTGEVLGFSSMGEHVHKSPDVSGFSYTAPDRDAFTSQINTYFASAFANSVPNITTSSAPSTIAGENYSLTLTATGGNAPLVWSLDSGSLPGGLGLSPDGIISGSATTAGTYNFTVRLGDSDIFASGDEDTQALSIVVSANSVPNITTTTLPAGTAGTAYSQTLAATGGNGTKIWSLASGSLPAGLSLSSGGGISGTPSAAGTASFTVRVGDSDGLTGPSDEDTQALSIVINPSSIGSFSAHGDIGSPGLAGSASYNSSTGTYTVTGGGTDIYGTSDKFQFVYEPWSGDGRMIARVTAVEGTHAWAKAGLMFRESLAPDSVNTDFILSASNGTQLLHRATTGGTTIQDANVTNIFAPYWLRLERHGSIFTGWESPDGDIWFRAGSTSFTMAASTYAGLAVTSHDNTQLNTSTFDNVEITNVPSWNRADIGSVGATGSFSADYALDQFTLNSAGSTIFGAADSFQFVYQTWTGGDATIIAEVTAVGNTHANAKGGIMIRQSLNANSAHALINLKAGSDSVEFIRRTTAGGSAAVTSATGVTKPRFLKLVRSGNNFSAYYLSDSLVWTQLGSTVTISMTGTVYVGLAGCSIVNTSVLSTSTFESVFVK